MIPVARRRFIGSQAMRIETRIENNFWPSDRGEDIAFMQGAVDDVAIHIGTPIIREVDRDAVLKFDPRIGIFAIVPGIEEGEEG